MTSINKKLFFIFFPFLICVAGCKTTTVKTYKVPLTTPPVKYYISDYTTKKELYVEYQHALMTIKEWQLWYNVNAGSNYYSYKEITNAAVFTNGLLEVTISNFNEMIQSNTVVTNIFITNEVHSNASSSNASISDSISSIALSNRMCSIISAT